MTLLYYSIDKGKASRNHLQAFFINDWQYLIHNDIS
jgi:hypothetical protein